MSHPPQKVVLHLTLLQQSTAIAVSFEGKAEKWQILSTSVLFVTSTAILPYLHGICNQNFEKQPFNILACPSSVASVQHATQDGGARYQFIAVQKITTLHNGVLLPTVCSPIVSASFCWDNNDLQEETLSGIQRDGQIVISSLHLHLLHLYIISSSFQLISLYFKVNY